MMSALSAALTLLTGQDGTTTTRTFSHLPTDIQAEEAEEVGVEHLLRDVKDNAVGTLSTRITHQMNALQGLMHHLTHIQSYLGDVVASRLPVNHQILYQLQTIMNTLPDWTQLMEKSLTTQAHDGMVATYVASLVRSVLALHALVDNKRVNRQADIDGSTEGKGAAKKDEKEKAEGKENDKPASPTKRSSK
jgi:26S proteasome regulatory subunit N8